MSYPEGKSLKIDTVSQNRQQTEQILKTGSRIIEITHLIRQKEMSFL